MTGENESSPLLQNARGHVGPLHGECKLSERTINPFINPRKNQKPRTNTTPAHIEGDSGRSGFHPQHFLPIIWRSSNPVSNLVNILWPFVLIAIVLRYAVNAPLWIFATSYIAVVPTANMLSFCGQQFAHKMPKLAGVLIEVALGSLVEVVLFVAILVQHPVDEAERKGNINVVEVIQAAILGSILTNLLLCMGLCFFFAGLRTRVQKLHAVVSETGNGVLLVAAFGLLVPSAFYTALKTETVSVLGEKLTDHKLEADVMAISQATSVVLIFAFVMYIVYCTTTSHSLFDEVIHKDEMSDRDREEDHHKPKLTMTEALAGLTISIALVTLLLVFLIEQIEYVVKSGVPDQFLGLILLPLVEKAAEQLTAIDDAWDGVINVAMYHCIGPSIQTALLNGPLIVIIGWIIGKPIDLNFEIFMIGLLVLSILVAGNFLRDGETNWLEGMLLVVSGSGSPVV